MRSRLYEISLLTLSRRRRCRTKTSVGFWARLPAFRRAVIVEEVLGDGRVSGGGGVGPVTADAFDGDAVPPQVPAEVATGNGPGAEGGLLGDQDVPVGGTGPGRATMVEPVPEALQVSPPSRWERPAMVMRRLTGDI